MALIRNIAGFATVGTGETGDGGKALLQNLVKFSDAAKEKGATGASDPLVMAVKLGLNLIPEGSFKKWVSMNPFQLYQKLWQAVFGRQHTTGQYRLGERLLDQIDPTTPVNGVVSYRDVKDEVVENAILLFTLLFGVRITTQEDLDALQQGATAYYQRPEKTDIPQSAVARAVYLKQTFFPDSMYNTAKWDTDIFSAYPLTAPIPDPYNVGQLYTGPIPGGGYAKNGMIEVDEFISEANPGTGPGAPGAGETNWPLIGGLLLLGYAGYEYLKKKKGN